MKKAILLLAVLLLAGCGDDPGKACFDTADHERLSDGKIKAMCDCAVREIERMNLSAPDQDLLGSVIRRKEVEPAKAARASELSGRWALAQANCRNR